MSQIRWSHVAPRGVQLVPNACPPSGGTHYSTRRSTRGSPELFLSPPIDEQPFSIRFLYVFAFSYL